MANDITSEVRIFPNGDKQWYLNGKYHREDGPAIEWANGTKKWFLNGKCHREDGPAIEWAAGSKTWFLNGNLHREDGPAIEFADGGKEWYLNGEVLTEEEFISRTSNASCIGKIIETNGGKFKLTSV
jgi:hypothetical protein